MKRNKREKKIKKTVARNDGNADQKKYWSHFDEQLKDGRNVTTLQQDSNDPRVKATKGLTEKCKKLIKKAQAILKLQAQHEYFPVDRCVMKPCVEIEKAGILQAAISAFFDQQKPTLNALDALWKKQKLAIVQGLMLSYQYITEFTLCLNVGESVDTKCMESVVQLGTMGIKCSTMVLKNLRTLQQNESMKQQIKESMKQQIKSTLIIQGHLLDYRGQAHYRLGATKKATADLKAAVNTFILSECPQNQWCWILSRYMIVLAKEKIGHSRPHYNRKERNNLYKLLRIKQYAPYNFFCKMCQHQPKEMTALKACPCDKAWYCDSVCQRNHFKEHKKFCRIHKAKQPNTFIAGTITCAPVSAAHLETLNKEIDMDGYSMSVTSNQGEVSVIMRDSDGQLFETLTDQPVTFVVI